MRTINVTYHQEDGSWWAESDDVPGFSALAETLSTLRGEVRAGLEMALDGADLDVRELLPPNTPAYEAKVSYSGFSDVREATSFAVGQLFTVRAVRASAPAAFGSYGAAISGVNCPA